MAAALPGLTQALGGSLYRLSLLLVSVVLAACSQWQARPTDQKARPFALIELDKCEGSGGTIQARGINSRAVCVLPFKDAGKACSDKSDCQGVCFAAPNAILGKDHSSGTCQKDPYDFPTCFQSVSQGTVMGGPCH